MTPHTRANLLLLGVVAIWGATFVVVKDALADASPTLFNVLRMLLALLVLLVVYRPRLLQYTRRQWLAGAGIGAALAAGYQFQTTGLKYTTPSKSAFITGSVVVLVPLFGSAAWLFRRTPSLKPEARGIFGAVIAFLGLALLTLPPGPSAISVLRAVNPGDWLTLGCAVAFSFQVLGISSAMRYTSYSALAVLQTAFAAMYLCVCLPVFEKPYLHWTPRLAFALAVTAVLATALAFSVQSYAQSVLSATNTALLLTLEPVFAWLTSFLVLGERLTGRGWAGAGLVLGGILITEMRPRPRLSAKAAA